LAEYVANFVFGVSIPLFAQVPTLHTTPKSGSVENAQLRFGLPRHCPFSTLCRPCLCFDRYFGNHWSRSANPPLCYAGSTSIS